MHSLIGTEKNTVWPILGVVLSARIAALGGFGVYTFKVLISVSVPPQLVASKVTLVGPARKYGQSAVGQLPMHSHVVISPSRSQRKLSGSLGSFAADLDVFVKVICWLTHTESLLPLVVKLACGLPAAVGLSHQ